MTLPASVALAPLNHLLRGAGWARRRLQPWVGRTAHLRLPPLPTLALTVQAGGEVASVPNDTPADTVLTLAPHQLPRLLAHDGQAYDEIRVSGDDAFAAAILHVGKHLRWDVEHDLSRVMGDIPAHRLTRTGRRLAHWHVTAARSLAGMLKEYLTEERPLLAKSAALQALAREVDALREETAGLEERIRALSAPPTARR